MATYLVTGGAGFIGLHIVEWLLQHDEQVRVLDNFSTGNPTNLAPFLDRIDLLEGDLRSAVACAEAVSGVDYVLHQAALPSVPRSIADPLSSHEANVTGTLNILIAARDANVKRFVYASSSSVYGDQPGRTRVEGRAPSPLSPYAASKMAGEYYVKTFAACYALPTVRLRYFNVFGPRQDPNSLYSAVIPRFITAMRAGKNPVVYGDGKQRRDFTYVENNVRANILAATAAIEAKGQVYNVACANSVSLLDLIAAINNILGTRLDPEFQPARIGDVRDSCADLTRARAELGYEPHINFDEGLRRTIAWHQQNT